jgi:hypothetical protein
MKPREKQRTGEQPLIGVFPASLRNLSVVR